MTFTATPNNSNLFFFFLDPGLTVTGSPTITTALFDGSVLLGTVSGTPTGSPGDYFYVAEFASPSVFPGVTAYAAASANLTSLNSGAINGILDVTVSGGTVGNIGSINSTGDGNIFLGDGVYAASYEYFPTYDVTATSAAITSSPEPATVSFVVSACLAFLALSKTRRHETRGPAAKVREA